MNYEIISRFLVALAIGGLVGLEREIYQQKKQRGFAGIRTYLLIAFAGALASFMLQQDEWRIFAYILLIGIFGLIIATYYVSAVKGYFGMTTEISVILVFVISMMSTYPDYQKFSVILGVILAVLLSLKKHLHSFAKSTKEIEWFNALTFVFMAFVILPLLPNENLTLFGVVNAFNPYRTWLMIVFASGVSFVGYFLAKVIGGSYGIGLAGLLGGVVSSTAVTESMASDSKRNPRLVKSYAFGATAASVIMGIRVLFEVWVIESSMLSMMAIPLIVIIAVGTLIAVQWIGEGELHKRSVDLKLGSPLSLRPALMFGILYSFVVFISQAMMSMNIGSYGFILLGLVAGLVDVDAITLSLTSLFSQGGVTEVVAWVTIVVAVISNSFFKMLTAQIFGSSGFFKRVGGALLIMAVAGIVSLLVYVL